ncbi:hypothetical protein LJ656_10405 [Paraburkholderia sp. MMS20-SJTR3]|uniref:Lipoprotein n=1 Tax=Paraburkholderia sejongensis TaxID=2886946 RepID=A0ABS8JTD3_9BURK|nr:hypothetical protein [Paraburkholderia sp. MMS20-SJTR3]MCC8393000.1 hypothetical protein [Paraburkholderia sp. MMS20-SJTR3]
MKSLCFAAALVVLVTGCTSTSSPASDQLARPPSVDTDTYMLHAPDGAKPASAERAQRLTVGTSYSDTQLILPWFLNDIINFVNYR